MLVRLGGLDPADTGDVGNGSRSYGDGGKGLAPLSLCETDGGAPMTQVDDLSRSLITFEQNSTMVVVLEMSQSSWLAAGVVPGIERRPLSVMENIGTVRAQKRRSRQ